MTLKTRYKAQLNSRQRQAALTIFGPEMGQSIISATQKKIDGLAEKVKALQAAADKMNARLTAWERAKGYPIAGRYFTTQNGNTSEIVANLFGGAK